MTILGIILVTFVATMQCSHADDESATGEAVVAANGKPTATEIAGNGDDNSDGDSNSGNDANGVTSSTDLDIDAITTIESLIKSQSVVSQLFDNSAVAIVNREALFSLLRSAHFLRSPGTGVPVQTFSLVGSLISCKQENVRDNSVTRDEDLITGNIDIDISACLHARQELTKSGFDNKADISYEYQVIGGSYQLRGSQNCPLGDIEALLEKPANTLVSTATIAYLPYLPGCQYGVDQPHAHKAFSLYKSHTLATVTTHGISQETEALSVVRNSKSNDGNVCITEFSENGIRTLNQCEATTINQVRNIHNAIGGTVTTVQSAKIVVPLTYSPFQKYFASGTVDYRFNNWTGTITFTDGAEAPVGAFTDGKETINVVISDRDVLEWNGEIPIAPTIQSYPEGTELHILAIDSPSNDSTLDGAEVYVDITVPTVIVLATNNTSINWHFKGPGVENVQRLELVHGDSYTQTVTGIDAAKITENRLDISDQRNFTRTPDELGRSAWRAFHLKPRSVRVDETRGRSHFRINLANEIVAPAGTALAFVDVIRPDSANVPTGTLPVTINKSGDVVLVLASTKVIHWKVTTGPQTNLIKVFVNRDSTQVTYEGFDGAIVEDIDLLRRSIIPSETIRADLKTEIEAAAGLKVSHYFGLNSATAISID